MVKTTTPRRSNLVQWGVAVVALFIAASLSTSGRADTSGSIPMAGGKEVRGTVVDANGKPAAGLQVRLLKPGSMQVGGPALRDPSKGPMGDASVGTPAPEQLQSKGGGDQLVNKVSTDNQGAFVFTDVPPGEYKLAAGMGKQQATVTIKVTADANPEPQKLQLRK